MSNQAQTQQSKFFDLHTKGIGYLSRIREVKPKKGDSFWACSIGALRGSSDKPEYTYFDCRISGAEANKLIRRCVEAVDADKKVLIGFTVGDIYTETFTFEKGEKKGQTGASLKGRLLYVSFIKVDGKEVYKAESKPENAETPAPEQAKARPEEQVAETAEEAEEAFA
jgi:predicted Zn-dependent protease